MEGDPPSTGGHSKQRRLHIVSWNVASWATALKEIRAQHGSLRNWADQHAIDILCLQEVKGTVAKLERDPGAFAAKEEGFDTFFALCQAGNGDSSSSKVGFNGVATFVRSGWTTKANSRPLGVLELDQQGRCIETHHGEFVLFNIYAPFDGHNADALPGKMNFLIRLRERMQFVRKETGKPVILAGDFNARYRLLDTSRESRIVDCRRLMYSEHIPGEPSITPLLKDALTRGISSLRCAIEKLECQPHGDRGRFRVFARHPKSNELKRINPMHQLWSDNQVKSYRPFHTVVIPGGISENDTAGFCYATNSLGYPVAELSDSGEGEVCWIARNEDSLCLEDFRILTQELLDVPWTDTDFETFSDFEAGGWLSPGKPCTSAWMESLLKDDGMVDSFAAKHPVARDRFTVWCQQTNDRFCNLGSRVDFIFVDKCLSIAENKVPLYGCACSTTEDCRSKQFRCADTAGCALAAATAYGRWKPAPFAGGGLPPGVKADYQTQFRTMPHTGIIYTPPSYSDHVACSCVIDNLPAAFFERNMKLSNDCESMTTRPYAKQRSLKDFFLSSGNKKLKVSS